MQSIFLSSIEIHPSWQPFFCQGNIQSLLQEIEKEIGNSYTPQSHFVLRFAETDLEKVRAVWQGRDPYPQPNKATGRSFEVNGVESWFDKEVNSSLKNIVKLLHKSYLNRTVCASIEEVREDIQKGNFPILPPNHAFFNWEKKGTLFLNNAFTCEIGNHTQAGSHEKLWKPFFLLLLAYMAKTNPHIRYFLWGRARDFEKTLLKYGVEPEYIYKSKHPSTNGDKGTEIENGYVDGYKRNTDFQNNPCFKETMDIIQWIEIERTN